MRALIRPKKRHFPRINKIGTTGRGIGPCYMDKVGRVGIKAGDLLDDALFRDKLKVAVEEKNFLLTQKYQVAPVEL